MSSQNEGFWLAQKKSCKHGSTALKWVWRAQIKILLLWMNMRPLQSLWHCSRNTNNICFVVNTYHIQRIQLFSWRWAKKIDYKFDEEKFTVRLKEILSSVKTATGLLPFSDALRCFRFAQSFLFKLVPSPIYVEVFTFASLQKTPSQAFFLGCQRYWLIFFSESFFSGDSYL